MSLLAHAQWFLSLHSPLLHTQQGSSLCLFSGFFSCCGDLLSPPLFLDLWLFSSIISSAVEAVDDDEDDEDDEEDGEEDEDDDAEDVPVLFPLAPVPDFFPGCCVVIVFSVFCVFCEVPSSSFDSVLSSQLPPDFYLVDYSLLVTTPL